MTLKFVTEGQYSKNIGSRTYLLDSNPDQYYMFYLLNKEFTFTVDVSELPCGLNGTLYFVEMEEDGGLKYPGNSAGPSYGTGYCDAQPSVLMTSSGSMERPTVRIGHPVTMMPMLARASMDPAAMNWTFGKQTQ